MPTAPQPESTSSGNGARNLFVDADPIDDDVLTEPDGATSKHAAARRRGHGRVITVDPSSPITAAPSRGARAATFTKPNSGIGRLRVVALERVRRAAVIAGRLLGRPARPYAALAAIGVLGGLLIALGWLGLAIGDASSARRAADQRLAVTAAALKHEQARIDTLSAQLSQAALIARRQQTTATAARTRRPQAAEREPARARRRRR